ncbi:MAG TPA: hypothetical protein VKS21_06040 [Spirochaetota bacterium]|nr:hypothetical protein [Spirochaetota bacterium]
MPSISTLFLIVTGLVLAVIGLLFYPSILPESNEKVKKTLSFMQDAREWIGIIALLICLFLGIKFISVVISQIKWLFILIAAGSLFITGMIIAAPKFRSVNINFLHKMADLGESLDKTFSISRNPRLAAMYCMLIGVITVILAIAF